MEQRNSLNSNPKYYLHLIVCGVVFLAILGLIMELRARSELNQGRMAVVGEDFEAALTHYSRALVWYIPRGSAETAAEELLEIGLGLTEEGEEEVAMRALLRVRSGLYGARWYITPRIDLIRRSEPVLALMLAKQKVGPDASPDQLENKKQDYLALMQKPSRPALLPGLAASFGFLLWVAAAFFFIFKFFQDIQPGWSRAWPWALVWGMGFGIWLWGLKWA